MSARPARSMLLVLAVAAACAGAADRRNPDRTASIGEVPREPLAVELAATRTGQALRVAIAATGRGARAGEAFEDPARWAITARQDGHALARLINGPVDLARSPAGTSQWDTVVRFSVVFELRGDGAVALRLEPPGAPAIEREVSP